MSAKNLFILAGANGSGKSTLASELLPEEKVTDNPLWDYVLKDGIVCQK